MTKPRPAPSPVQQPAPPPAPAVTATVLPALGEIHVVTRDPQLITLTFGSLRVEITFDGPAVAREWFATPIVAAAQTSNGWVFAAADGVVARADTFTGPLTVLGAAPRESGPPPRVMTTCGRIAIASGDTVYTTDGSGPLSSSTPAPGGTVVDAAFADADRGMAVVEGGELYETRDAAKAWRKIDLGEDAAAGVRCEAGKLRVDTFAASVLFDADGTRDTKTPEAAMTISPEVRQAVRRAALHEFPDLAPGFGGVLLGDGTARFLERGRLVSELPPELGRFSHELCTLMPWGDAAGVLCEDTLYRGNTSVAANVRHPNLANDGSAIWDCTPRPDPRQRPPQRPQQKECVRLAGGRVIERPGSASLSLVHGDRIVRGHWDGIEIDDAATGAKRSQVAITLPHENEWFEWFQLSGDGAIAYANGRAKSGPYVVIVTLDGGASRTVPLPDGTAHAGFLDGHRGVAAGPNLARVWITEDAGATWQPLPAAVDGAIAARPGPYAPKWLPEWSVQCAAQRCQIDGRVVVDFSGAAIAGRAIASPEPIAATAEAQESRMECGDRAYRALPAADRLRERTVSFQTPAANVEMAVAGTAWDFAWVGRDRLGAYRARAAGTLPSVANAEYRLFHATRQGLIFERQGSERDQYIWVPAGGRPIVIPEPSMRGFVDDALVLPDGRAILIREVPAEHGDDLAFRWGFLLDRSGKLVARRALWWPDDERATIIAAVIDGVPGVAHVFDDPAQPVRFVPIAPGSGTTLPPIAPAALPLCTGPATSTPAVVPANGDVRGVDTPSPELLRVYLRAGGEPCVEAYELVATNRHYAHEPFVVAARDGVLAGELLLRDSVSAFSCKPPVASSAPP